MWYHTVIQDRLEKRNNPLIVSLYFVSTDEFIEYDEYINSTADSSIVTRKKLLSEIFQEAAHQTVNEQIEQKLIIR